MTQQALNEERLLVSSRTAADMLAVSLPTLSRLVRRGQLRSVKLSVGRSGGRRFSPAELRRFVERQTQGHVTDPG